MLTRVKNYLRSKLEGILKKQEGATMVEYGLMVALIALFPLPLLLRWEMPFGRSSTRRIPASAKWRRRRQQQRILLPHRVDFAALCSANGVWKPLGGTVRNEWPSEGSFPVNGLVISEVLVGEIVFDQCTGHGQPFVRTYLSHRFQQ